MQDHEQQCVVQAAASVGHAVAAVPFPAQTELCAYGSAMKSHVIMTKLARAVVLCMQNLNHAPMAGCIGSPIIRVFRCCPLNYYIGQRVFCPGNPACQRSIKLKNLVSLRRPAGEGKEQSYSVHAILHGSLISHLQTSCTNHKGTQRDPPMQNSQNFTQQGRSATASAPTTCSQAEPTWRRSTFKHYPQESVTRQVSWRCAALWAPEARSWDGRGSVRLLASLCTVACGRCAGCTVQPDPQLSYRRRSAAHTVFLR